MGSVIVIAAASVVLCTAAFAVYAYNSLVSLKNAVEGARADIEAMLKKRHDLVFSLAEAACRYIRHESDVFEKVTKLRAEDLKALKERSKADESIRISDMAVRGIFAVAENYPQLKSYEEFNRLMDSLTEVEKELANARRYYNAVLRDYNARKQMFPYNLFSAGFPSYEYVYAPEDEEKRPELGRLLG